MKMNLDWRQVDIRWFAVAASLLLSISTLFSQEVPNSDAYTYARTAEIFLADGLKAAYQHYSWASYSILIGIVSWSGLDVFSAGLLVNALFYALLVYAFLSIAKEIKDSRALLLLAAISILVYPQLNEYRELIIRDTGFWALSLFALWQYLLYTKTQSKQHAVVFCTSLLIAASFRAEAIAYLVFTPLGLLLDYRMDIGARSRLLVRMYTIMISLSVGLLIFLALMGLNVGQLFIDFASIYEPFITGNFTLNDEERALLGSLLFTEYAATFSREYIEIFLLAGMIAILLANLISAIGAPYLLVVIVARLKKQTHLEREIAVPLIFYLCMNLLILLGFLLLTRYLSSRYAILMCILLALFVPIVMLHFLESAKPSNQNRIRIVIAIFFSYCAIDSYYSFGESKSYVRDSIEWIAQNTDEDTGLVTNNHALAYFSGKIENYNLTQRNLSEEEILSSEAGDTIAAELTFETQKLLEREDIADKLMLLASFPNSEKQRILVFQRLK
ncbi:MAG TPA: hypothetical protein DCS33_03105 [Gammaproteobacteria bacterium]|jgi:hypothetical protein|nr:hypothetical protein [Gammaproteobacteria bacterium]MBT6481346.1 hypothetical protein [Gammaproteobacteria bacterium]HAS48280.1 hypothetical protein [Gammaproteobacteria bacterium]